MKVAILIDGGYLLKRLPSLRKDIDCRDAKAVDYAIGGMIDQYLHQLNGLERVPNPRSLLYRCFYYDALPYKGTDHLPISKKSIDYSKSNQTAFRLELFQRLRVRHSFAVRLGEVRRERGWILTEDTQKALLKGDRQIADLRDDDFSPGLRQKAVDMRIGLDIASITLKRQADNIILVTGDSDFVPAAKLARREGVRFYLDPVWRNVSNDLYEHVDGLISGFDLHRTPTTDIMDRQEGTAQ